MEKLQLRKTEAAFIGCVAWGEVAQWNTECVGGHVQLHVFSHMLHVLACKETTCKKGPLSKIHHACAHRQDIPLFSTHTKGNVIFGK